MARFAAARTFFTGFLVDLEGVSVEEDSDLKRLVTGTVEGESVDGIGPLQ